MKNTPNLKAEEYRVHHGPLGTTREAGNNGCFMVPFGKSEMAVIVSCGDGWDHVSVSLRDRCPTWQEMDFVKNLFFRDDECVMQLHPPRKDWVNCHPNCLHLWRPQGQEIPRPPHWMVAPFTDQQIAETRS